MLRRLIKLTEEIENDCYLNKEPVEVIMEETEKKMFQLLGQRNSGDFMPIRQVVINTLPGMLPLACNNEMNKLFAANARIVNPQVNIRDAGHFNASTDMGDVSHLMPVIHPFIGGTDGFLHTAGFHVVDFDAAVILPAKAFAMTIIDLLADGAELGKKIKAEHKPLMTKAEYIAKLESYFG